MQYCIFCIQDFYESNIFENPETKINEPFEGLFTQGMVCHETYKDHDNNWISPEETTILNGERVLKVNNQIKQNWSF